MVSKQGTITKVAPPTGDDDLLTTDEVARWLRCTDIHLIHLRKRGGGPVFVKLGYRSVRYRRGAVRAWLLERERSTLAEAEA